MVDMLALIARILRAGCPNCGQRAYLQRRREASGPMVTDSLSCNRCAITWEAPAIPVAELGGFAGWV